MSTDRREWGYLSPGRLIIIEAMKHFVERGVRRFDLGVGDDPFIRSFGVEHVPLYDLIVARDLTVVPRAMFHRLKGWLRRTRHTRSASQHFKPHFAR
jgi:CelD/BcsL family acetyltransferase involved in cellulose biosynthesis